MIEAETIVLLSVFLVGTTIILAILIKAGLERISISLLLGYLLLGMVLMDKGRQLGDWAVSPQIFSTTVLVAAITCIISPILLRPLLQKWQEIEFKK